MGFSCDGGEKQVSRTDPLLPAAGGPPRPWTVTFEVGPFPGWDQKDWKAVVPFGPGSARLEVAVLRGWPRPVDPEMRPWPRSRSQGLDVLGWLPGAVSYEFVSPLAFLLNPVSKRAKHPNHGIAEKCPSPGPSPEALRARASGR